MRFSSLRCFFFAIRLRRFLMTEPTATPKLEVNPAAVRRPADATFLIPYLPFAVGRTEGGPTAAGGGFLG